MSGKSPENRIIITLVLTQISCAKDIVRIVMLVSVVCSDRGHKMWTKALTGLWYPEALRIRACGRQATEMRPLLGFITADCLRELIIVPESVVFYYMVNNGFLHDYETSRTIHSVLSQRRSLPRETLNLNLDVHNSGASLLILSSNLIGWNCRSHRLEVDFMKCLTQNR